MMDEFKDYLHALVIAMKLSEPSVHINHGKHMHYFEIRSRGLIVFMITRDVTKMNFVFNFTADEKHLFDQLDGIVRKIDPNRCKLYNNAWEPTWKKPSYRFDLMMGNKKETTRFMRSLL